jgi:hypothetical protein
MKKNQSSVFQNKFELVFCIFMLLFLAPHFIKAQDKIHKTDNTVIEAKVIEITDVEIKYKIFSNQSGPTYTIGIPEVSMIVYENGEKEVYNEPKVKPTTAVTNNPVTTETKPTSSTNNDTKKSEPQSFDKGLYLNIGPGFGINAASQSFDNNVTNNNSSADYEDVHGSLGKGMNLGIGLGLMIHKNIAIELGLNYLKGTNIKTTNTDNSSSPFVVKTNTRKASMLRIVPAVVFTVGEGNLKPYARVGFIVGVAGKMISDYTETGSGEIDKTTKFSGRIALGYATALGIKYGSGKVSYFGELGMINQSWAPAKSEITALTKNGTDQLANLTTSEIETEYIGSYSSSTLATDENAPAQKVKKYFPMSSFGINVGIRISF